MCAVVYYRKSKGGGFYLKAIRTSPYAYAMEATRVNGKVEIVRGSSWVVRNDGGSRRERE